MAAMGLCEGVHKLGNMTVEVKDSRTSVAGTDTLAGRLVRQSVSYVSYLVSFFFPT